MEENLCSIGTTKFRCFEGRTIVLNFQLQNVAKRHLIRKGITSFLVANMLCMSLASPVLNAMSNKGDILTASSYTPALIEEEELNSIPSVDSLGLKVKSAILMEVLTGQVLLNIKGDEARPPASMVKMMTE